MTRAEHLAWCKKRALEYVDHGDLPGAAASMVSDLNKHEGTAQSAGGVLGMMGLQFALANDEKGMRDWITGFN